MANEEKIPKPEVSKEPPPEILKMNFSMDNSDVTLDPKHENITIVDDKSGKISAAKTTEPEKETKEQIEERLQSEKLSKAKEEEKSKSTDKVSEGDKKADKPGDGDKGKEQSVSSILRPPSKGADKKDGETKGKEEIKPFTPKPKVERDYTGFSAEQVEHLKQMSDTAYKYTTDLIKQNKELSSKATGMFFQHPEAYTLTPEFKENRTIHQTAQRSAEVWSALLEKVKNNEKIRMPQGFDKNGNLVFSSEVLEPSGPLEEALRNNILISNNAMRDQDVKLESLKTGFTSQFTSDESRIQTERKNRFAWAADPKVLDYVVTTADGGEKSIKQIKDEFKSIFPSYRQGDSIVEVASDLMAVIVYQNAELQEALKGKKVAEKEKESVAKLEPNPDGREVEQKPPVGGVREFSIEGMPT